ncbi:MAG TPA: hypothetical protein VFZ53_20865 [Polyangiaceae bacterium]
MTIETWIVLAGVGQLGLALGSLALPRVLDWRADTAKLVPLTRKVFWTYAGYIWATNVCFGVLSVTAPGALLDGSTLARVVGGYITAYWGARVLIQLFYFDRADAPEGFHYRVAEGGLTLLFVGLTAVYGYATVR